MSSIRLACGLLFAAGQWIAAWSAEAAATGIFPPRPAPPAGVPVVPFENDKVITNWLYACPGSFAQQLVEPSSDWTDSARAELLSRFKPLPQDKVCAESYPDFAPAIDLRGLGGGADGVSMVFLSVLEVDKPRLVRLCVGTVGEGVSGRLWLGRTGLFPADLIRLAPGRYPLVVQASSGRTRHRWQWRERRVAPRFTEVTEEEIREVHAWEVGVWQGTMDAAGTVRGHGEEKTAA